MSSVPISLTVNGQPYAIEVQPQHTLLRVLRDQLGWTGVKECCSAGECGACTVLFEGDAVNSCLVLGVEADGAEIVTIEGVAQEGHLDPLQVAFLTEGAVQCGFCIPGMILAAKYLLATNPNPSPAEIQEGLAGNLCRCAGYTRIIQAVLTGAKAGAR
jgi:carbon-monoxide dehydrogenase small subunit